jgi:hypothetical protein
MVKKIYCDLDTPENNYDYQCPQLDSWGEYSDYETPCEYCPHRCYKTVAISQ